MNENSNSGTSDQSLTMVVDESSSKRTDKLLSMPTSKTMSTGDSLQSQNKSEIPHGNVSDWEKSEINKNRTIELFFKIASGIIVVVTIPLLFWVLNYSNDLSYKISELKTEMRNIKENFDRFREDTNKTMDSLKNDLGKRVDKLENGF